MKASAGPNSKSSNFDSRDTPLTLTSTLASRGTRLPELNVSCMNVVLLTLAGLWLMAYGGMWNVECRGG